MAKPATHCFRCGGPLAKGWWSYGKKCLQEKGRCGIEITLLDHTHFVESRTMRDGSGHPFLESTIPNRRIVPVNPLIRSRNP